MQDFYNAIKDLAAGEVYALVAAQDAKYPPDTTLELNNLMCGMTELCFTF